MTARAVRRPFVAAGRGWHLAFVHWRIPLAGWAASLVVALAGAFVLASSAGELSRRPALDAWASFPPLAPSPVVDAAGGGLPPRVLVALQQALSRDGIRHPSDLPAPGRNGLPLLVVVLFATLVAGPTILALAAGRLGAAGETAAQSFRRRFPAFVALASGAFATIVAAYGLLVVAGGVIVDRTLPADATERWVATAAMIRWGALLLVAVAVGRVVGVTRARLAVESPPALRDAFREALAVSVRHPVGLVATGTATLLPALLLLAVGFEAGGFGVSPPVLGPWATFAVAQALVLSRQFQKVAVLAADVQFCRQLGAAGEPRLVRIDVAEAAPPHADRRSAWRLLSPRRPPAPAFVVPTTISGWSANPAEDRTGESISLPAERPDDMLRLVVTPPVVLPAPTEERGEPAESAIPATVDPTAWSAAIDGIDRENEIAAREEALSLDRPVDLTGPPTILPPNPSGEIFVPHEATLAARVPERSRVRFDLPGLRARLPRFRIHRWLAALSRIARPRVGRPEPVRAATHWEPLLHDEVPESPAPAEPRIDVLAAARRREKR